MSKVKAGQTWQSTYNDEMTVTVNRVTNERGGTVYATIHLDGDSNNGREVAYIRDTFEGYFKPLSEVEQTSYQMLEAGHDSNGNKNALYVEYGASGDLRAVYAYNLHIPRQLYNSTPLMTLEVSKKQLTEIRKNAKKSDTVLWYD